MYRLFRENARNVMETLADDEARRFNHEYVGTEHILLGLMLQLIDEIDVTALLCILIVDCKLTVAKIRIEIGTIVQSGPSGIPLPEKLPFTPRAKKVYEYALEEARDRVPKGALYTVELHDILLGLLREQEGVAAQVLMNLGLRLEDIRDAIITALEPPLVRMKALIGKPGISDDELTDVFELIVQNISTMHSALTALEPQ